MKLFYPTSPAHFKRLSNSCNIGKELLDVTAPVIDPATLERAIHVAVENSGVAPDSDCENTSDSEKAYETKMILSKINARRVVHAEYTTNNMESEPLGGYVMRLEKGRLGLSKRGD